MSEMRISMLSDGSVSIERFQNDGLLMEFVSCENLIEDELKDLVSITYNNAGGDHFVMTTARSMGTVTGWFVDLCHGNNMSPDQETSIIAYLRDLMSDNEIHDPKKSK